LQNSKNKEIKGYEMTPGIKEKLEAYTDRVESLIPGDDRLAQTYIQLVDAIEDLEEDAEIGRLVKRLPELIEYCEIKYYPNTGSWLVSDGGGCLSPRRHHSKQILEALREANNKEQKC
jgi:hypothetical protein